MPPHFTLATTDRARGLGALIEQAHRLSDAVEERGVELRLAVMQAKVRLAELKATLWSLQHYL